MREESTTAVDPSAANEGNFRRRSTADIEGRIGGKKFSTAANEP
jgi:hypothetical protein